MIGTVPFVAKVLEPSKDNMIFKPPNPWTMAILSLLCEIYNERDLKLNLKFEMERLFKHLDVNIKDIEPSMLLASRMRDRQNNPDFVADKNFAAPVPLQSGPLRVRFKRPSVVAWTKRRRLACKCKVWKARCRTCRRTFASPQLRTCRSLLAPRSFDSCRSP